MLKRSMCIVTAAVIFAALLMGGCSKEETIELIPSDLTGAQVQEEFWNTNLDASAEYLNGYRAQSPDEVVRNWKQAKMQGNGAIIYALYNEDMKTMYLAKMKNIGIWNFYYGNEAEIPKEITYSVPQKVEDEYIDNMYYSTITTIKSDGMTTTTHDIFIEFENGGFFVTGDTAEEVIS